VQKYWKLSKNHDGDIKNIIENYYMLLKPFYDNSDLKNLLIVVIEKCKSIIYLLDSLNLFLFCEKDYNKQNLYSYLFLNVFNTYIEVSTNPEMLNRENYNTETYSDELKILKQNTIELLISYLNIFSKQKSIINVNYQTIMDRFFKVKEKEKNTITDRLKQLTTEAREVDNLLKKNKLGLWNKGLQKGLRAYVAETYDIEREKIQEPFYENEDINDDDVNRLREESDEIAIIQNIQSILKPQSYEEDFFTNYENQTREREIDDEDNNIEYLGDDNDEYNMDDDPDDDYAQETYYGED
jgi:hypothetical protein